MSEPPEVTKRPPRRIEASLNLIDAQALLSATQTCVLVHDAESKDILWANPAACALLEFSVDELRPLKAPDMSSSSSQYRRSIGRAWLNEAVETGVSQMVWRYRAKSGREYATDAIARRVDLSDGPAVMVQFRDIEAELHMKESLARAEALFAVLARHSVNVVLVLDTDNRIEYATAAAERLLGTDDVVGRLLDDLVGWREGAEPTDSPTPSHGEGVAIRMRTLRSGRWLGGVMERLTLGGESKRVITLHDITELRAAEIRRARLADYENHLARFNAMGDLALTVTHELAQPLAAASNFLAGSLSRVAQQAALAPMASGLTSARRQIERANTILDSLRDFVAEQEHRTRLVDLNEVVDESLYFVRVRAEDAGVTLQVQLEPAPLPVRCESVLTGQVVLNLCFNGIDEMAGRDGVLTIRTRAAVSSTGAPMACFEVEDRGRGIPPELAAGIFEAGITSKEHGNGIGLALSRQVIARQRGEIKVVPGEESGSVFVFSLPIANQ